MRASIDAQRNLNSAELENIKITNTLVAARTRLSSSWDRLVNSGGSGVSRLLTGALNTGSGLLAGVFNNFGKGSGSHLATYFDTPRADWKGIALSIIKGTPARAFFIADPRLDDMRREHLGF